MSPKKQKILTIVFAVSLFLITVIPASADKPTELAERLIQIVRNILSPIIVILNGFIILLTVIAIVKSGVRAQYLHALGMRMHLSMEWITIIEVIMIFVAYAALYPITNAVVQYVASRASSIYTVPALNRVY